MKYYFLALGTAVVVCVGCAYDTGQVVDTEQYVAPPAGLMQRPGPMVDGPGPGVLAMMGPGPATQAAPQNTQVKFVGPLGMAIGWGIGQGFAENQLYGGGSFDFQQGATYQLKLSEIPGHDNVTLYPTLQVFPADPSTGDYLAHNSVPLELTEEDISQIESNNFVTKVIYLPEPKYQELAIAGVETLVSTRLEPGVDPVAEADRRGTIMAVLRVGNKNLEMPAGGNADGQIQQTSYTLVDGEAGQHVAPAPIAIQGPGMPGPPNTLIMGGGAFPGHPAQHPIAGMGPIPSWGMPMTGTPIGLPGPAHLPFGGQAALQSYTMRDLSKDVQHPPVRDLLIDVKRDPGYSTPPPVRHVEYTETHPVFAPGEVNRPAGR